MAFATILGTFVSHVMQQGDCNVPATFQQLMTWVFREYIGIFIRVYLDDMFVYLDSLDDHKKHLKIAFRILQEHRLFLGRSKCDLYSEDMDCLGHRIDDHMRTTGSMRFTNLITTYQPTSAWILNTRISPSLG